MPATLAPPRTLGNCPHCGGQGYYLTPDGLLPAHPIAGSNFDRPACTGQGRTPTDIRRDTFFAEGVPWA